MLIELDSVNLIPWIQFLIVKFDIKSIWDVCDKITVWLIPEMLTLLMLWTFESTKFNMQILTKHENNWWQILS